MNQLIIVTERPPRFWSLFKRMWWSTVLKAALRSSSTRTESFYESKLLLTSIAIFLSRVVTVLWFIPKPHWYFSKIPFLFKKSFTKTLLKNGKLHRISVRFGLGVRFRVRGLI